MAQTTETMSRVTVNTTTDKFWICDWQGNRHEMSAIDLRDRITADSKSNYNWIAPACEIVRTVSDPKFPEEWGNHIKSLILTCYANLLCSPTIPNRKPDDYLAVAYCYYTVTGKKGKKAKRLYRRNTIKLATVYPEYLGWSNPRPHDAHGDQWNAFYREFVRDAMANFTNNFGVDIMRWATNIHAKFNADVVVADKLKHRFDEDKERHAASMTRIAKSIVG